MKNSDRTGRIRRAEYPEYKDNRYIIIDGKIYLNVSAEPGGIVVGRFLRTLRGTDGRGR